MWTSPALRYRHRRLLLRLRWLRGQMRSSEAFFILLAVAVGIVAGAMAALLGAIAHGLQRLLFDLAPGARLSGTAMLEPLQLLLLPVGGGALALFSLAVRARKRAMVDAIEANTLHGGRMSVRDSLILSGQTVISNGFGASVGLEAAYAQMGSVGASWLGRRLNLRRGDVRTLVGAGAGAAVGAAFGAPLAGAFYAFEIVIGAYTPSALAPIAAATLAGVVTGQVLGIEPYILDVAPGPAVHTLGYAIAAALGGICALAGIGLMRAVTATERLARAHVAGPLRPALGGLLLVPVAMLSPQVLSAGHSALHLDLGADLSLGFVAAIFLAKCASSVLSLGFGFRGGLFFASLFLGTLLGHLFAGTLAWATGGPLLDPGNTALVGMAALAVAVVGGPMCMAMLVLEATGNFSLTGAVLAACLISSTIVRTQFGYSFSTWRLHLRGETVKSARDIGWAKTLTAGRLMRRETRATAEATTVAEFRRRFPLGSASRVVLVDEAGRYAGIVEPSAAYAEGVDPAAAIATLARLKDNALTPQMPIHDVMQRFDTLQADELAVLGPGQEVLGIISETHLRRRYAEELEKAHRDLFRER